MFLNFRVLSWSIGIRFKRFFSWDPQIWTFHLRSQVSSSDRYCSALLWSYYQICVPISEMWGIKQLWDHKSCVCVCGGGKANKTNSVWRVLQNSLEVYSSLRHTWEVKPKRPLACCLLICPLCTACLDTKFT